MKSSHKILSLLSLVLVACIGLAPNTFAAPKANKIPTAKCKEFPGSRFANCICASEVPKSIQYRPSLAACGGDAAAIMSGQFSGAYSIVLRDSQNRDRWPASGYNGCSAAQVEAGLNKCSAFKCQSVKRVNGAQVCCFGEPGSSKILAGATRMTVKLRDIPGSNSDPLLRLCLPGFDPTEKLN